MGRVDVMQIAWGRPAQNGNKHAILLLFTAPFLRVEVCVGSSFLRAQGQRAHAEAPDGFLANGRTPVTVRGWKEQGNTS